MRFSPKQDYVLVELDPMEEKTKGGIILPDDRPGTRIRTATVLRVGPGKWIGKHRDPVGVEPGEKIAFLRWHLEHATGKTVSGILAEMGENKGLVRRDDILFAFDASEKGLIE